MRPNANRTASRPATQHYRRPLTRRATQWLAMLATRIMTHAPLCRIELAFTTDAGQLLQMCQLQAMMRLDQEPPRCPVPDYEHPGRSRVSAACLPSVISERTL